MDAFGTPRPLIALAALELPLFPPLRCVTLAACDVRDSSSDARGESRDWQAAARACGPHRVRRAVERGFSSPWTKRRSRDESILSVRTLPGSDPRAWPLPGTCEVIATVECRLSRFALDAHQPAVIADRAVLGPLETFGKYAQSHPTDPEVWRYLKLSMLLSILLCRSCRSGRQVRHLARIELRRFQRIENYRMRERVRSAARRLRTRLLANAVESQ